jgi:hypothetical protein
MYAQDNKSILDAIGSQIKPSADIDVISCAPFRREGDI